MNAGAPTASQKGATRYNKEGWEKAEFPIVCETCLGDNPYVRMMKAEFDKECKVCSRPFTVFRWKPGGNARYKKTEVCQTCAKIKNVCQTCLLDLEYGLPVQVRDAALPSQTLPTSDVNREWFAEQAEKAIAMGLPPPGQSETRAQLAKIARNSPYYKRNQAHVCSFFVKGNCTRGSQCPYRHELPEENELSHQNMKDRYHGINDPVAKKLLSKHDALSLNPPLDKEIKTLYVGNVTEDIADQDIKDAFYAYGELQEVRMVPKSSCAFVTYTTRQSAENAVSNLVNNLVIKGSTIRISWGRPQQFDLSNNTSTSSTIQETTTNGSNGSNYFSLPTGPQVFTPPPPNPSFKPSYPSMNPGRLGSKKDNLKWENSLLFQQTVSKSSSKSSLMGCSVSSISKYCSKMLFVPCCCSPTNVPKKSVLLFLLCWISFSSTSSLGFCSRAWVC